MSNSRELTKGKIDFFDGTDYDFLSNFHRCGTIVYDGRPWMTTEHAYQAMKTRDRRHQDRIQRAPTPGKAKELGQRRSFEEHGVAVRHDWEEAKYRVMLDLLRLKFAKPQMRVALARTGSAELVEGNTWNDTCWGVYKGRGQNHLGRQLMRVRSEIRALVTGTGGTFYQATYVEAGERYIRTETRLRSDAIAARALNMACDAARNDGMLMHTEWLKTVKQLLLTPSSWESQMDVSGSMVIRLNVGAMITVSRFGGPDAPSRSLQRGRAA